jgi:hypothetical protein
MLHTLCAGRTATFQLCMLCAMQLSAKEPHQERPLCKPAPQSVMKIPVTPHAAHTASTSAPRPRNATTLVICCADPLGIRIRFGSVQSNATTTLPDDAIIRFEREIADCILDLWRWTAEELCR